MGKYNSSGYFGGLDYDPFGMLIVGRSFESGSGYRYGFNGKENDDEINGNNNAIDFGARVYDSRLGRWFNTDPMKNKYPNLSPYNFTMNNPILLTDVNGEDVGVTIEGHKITLTSTIYITGYGADISKKEYDLAYAAWSQADKNKSTFTDASGNVWEIEIQMVFEVTDDVAVIDKIKNAGPGSAAENLIEFKGNIRSHADYIDDLVIQDGKYTLVGGKRYVAMNDYADGFTAIHEVLHLYGLIDRYSDMYYDKYDTDGTCLGQTEVESVSHAGYENNAMGTLNYKLENMNLNSTQFSNLGNSILNDRVNHSDGNSFVFSKMPSDVESSDSAVPNTFTKDGITYDDPKQ